MSQTLTADPAVVELNQKLDRLVTQVEFLTEEAQRQKRRRQEFDELKDDLIPIGNDLFKLTVTQLEEIQQYVQLEDMLRLLKRLARNTRNIEQMLDQMESLMEFVHDAGPLGQDAFLSAMQQLNEMDRKGYFVFLQGGLDMIDRVVSSFTEDDVQQLADNVVLILQTVKEMTQPEIMTMLKNTAETAQSSKPVDTSLFSIVKQLNDPSVRTGLAKTLTVLKTVGEHQPK